MPANVDELVVRVADICTYKWDMIRHRPMAYLITGFAGGAMVVFGATLALAVSAGVSENLAPGLANLLMGLVFMFSLVIIMVSGMTLVTADMYIGIIGVFHRRIRLGMVRLGRHARIHRQFPRQHVFHVADQQVWKLCAICHGFLRAHAIGVAKLGQTASQIFVMGIVCTWMLQTAAILYVKAEATSPKSPWQLTGPLHSCLA